MNYPVRFSAALAVVLSLSTPFALSHTAFAQRGRQGNPFAPPQATVHYAPDRDYDLKHLAVTLRVDYPHRAFTGTAVNTLSPIRGNLTDLRFHCGEGLTVQRALVNGKTASFKRSGEFIVVTAPHPIAQGQEISVTLHYTGGSKQGRGFGATTGGGGLHWISPTPSQPNRVGFWTQGETSGNRDWAPTWDYPNDFTTSETTTTVPIGWTVIGNGLKVSDVPDPKAGTRTVHWKMDLPHATYLLSLAAGPFDVKEARWRNKPLLYVVPKGKGNLIDDSFGDTPDMLTFFSSVTGVEFPWPKYAQDAMYDFGGGMENVSATTLGENSLTDRREGYRDMASLNSHELAHQWFGDFVTCNDWGQIWLNESFATFFEMLYLEHSTGKNVYDREVAGNIRSYLAEAQRYKHPLATNFYSNPDAMFDSHTYPKGGVILHTLRRRLGDRAFFAGLNHYLTTHAHTPVTSADLCEAMTQSSGINLQPFFDQWIYKPGHPVLDYSWKYDDTAKAVSLTVKQTQDTSDGTPIYDLPLTVGIIANGHLTRVPIHTDKEEATISLPATLKPDAVLLDPDHDLLREIPSLPWQPSELPAIVQYAPCGVDKSEALRRLLFGEPSEETVHIAADAVRQDTAPFPAFDSILPLVALHRASLRPLFRQLLSHPNGERRAQAIAGLAPLGPDPEDVRLLRGLINDQSPYAVVAAAVRTLGDWDAKGNADILARAANMPSRREVIRTAAFTALLKANPDAGIARLVAAAKPGNPDDLRTAAIRAMGTLPADEPKSKAALKAALHDPAPFMPMAAVMAVAQRKDKDFLPDLRALAEKPPQDAPGFFRGVVNRAIDSLQNGTALNGLGFP